MAPTDIGYDERINPPYESHRKVEVYGNDKSVRLAELPKDIAAFEKALTSVVEDVKRGAFKMGVI